MAQVQADVEHLRVLKRDLTKASQEITEALRRVDRSLSRASWKDPVRQKFEDEFKLVKSSGKRITDTNIPSLIAVLQAKIADLEKYLA